jgi:hypothetical protein
MKDVSSFYCNCDYILLTLSVSELHDTIRTGLRCEKHQTYKHEKYDPLLPQKHDGVYGIAVFRQWKDCDLSKLSLLGMGYNDQVILKIDKSVLLYLPFHFNKIENYGRKQSNNTLVSDDTDYHSVWHYDVVRNHHELHLNEIVFHKDIAADFIKEIWYFSKDVPHELYNFHCRKPLICNIECKLI